MTEEAYVSFETAKLLKDKGFNRYPLFPCYREDNGKFINIPTTLNTINYCFIPAPTQQMAMRWLREVHNIYMDIAPTHSINGPIDFIWQTYNLDYLVTGDCDIFYPTYEQAVEEAIKYSLKNLI